MKFKKKTVQQNNNGRISIKPGMLFLDDDMVWSGTRGDFLYITCSKEPGKDWLCKCFQEWSFGAYDRYFTAAELNKLKYIGILSDLREPKGVKKRGNMGAYK